MFNCEFEKCICQKCDENFMNLGKCTDCCDCEPNETKIVTECSMFESEDTLCNQDYTSNHAGKTQV